MKSKLIATVAILSLVALTACNKPVDDKKKEVAPAQSQSQSAEPAAAPAAPAATE